MKKIRRIHGRSGVTFAEAEEAAQYLQGLGEI
jgi:hypothetical protein